MEGCSHVAALIFKVKYAVRQGFTSITFQSCQWNKTYCDKVSHCMAARVLLLLLFFVCFFFSMKFAHGRIQQIATSKLIRVRTL